MADEKPTDDLRSILSASFDDAMTGTALSSGTVSVPKSDVAAASKTEAEPAKDSSDKDGSLARAEDGKFAKKEKDCEAKPDAKADDKDNLADKDATKTEAKPEGDDKATDKSAEKKSEDKTDELLSKWSASDKAMFKLQSPEAQEFLLRRHKAMESDYTKKTAAVADLKKEFEPIQQMFASHLEVLKAKGLTPAATIRAWANVETALANGRGVDVIKGMIDGYGIDKAALGKALGFTSATAAEPSIDATKVAPDPSSAAHQPINLPPELVQELRDLRARLDAQENEKQTSQITAAREREAKVESDITNFKSAANEKGELLHPFYEEVEPVMVALAQSYVASKQPLPPLAELYETAVRANPSTYAALRAAERRAWEAERDEQARAKAASARRAGSSVTGAPGSGQATAPIRGEMTLREQLEEAAAQ